LEDAQPTTQSVHTRLREHFFKPNQLHSITPIEDLQKYSRVCGLQIGTGLLK
jgi:hypothetical protein